MASTSPSSVLSASAPPPPDGTLDQLANYLTDGFWAWAGEGYPQHWDTSVSNIVSHDVQGLDQASKFLAFAAINVWSPVANIQFEQVTSGAQPVFNEPMTGLVAQGGATSLSYDASGHYAITAAEVDISKQWITDCGSTYDSCGAQTYVHEIGHALGLGHRGPYGLRASFPADAAFGNDCWKESVMSYFSEP